MRLVEDERIDVNRADEHEHTPLYYTFREGHDGHLEIPDQ